MMKKNNKKFYLSSAYWNYKNRRAILEIKEYNKKSIYFTSK